MLALDLENFVKLGPPYPALPCNAGHNGGGEEVSAPERLLQKRLHESEHNAWA